MTIELERLRLTFRGLSDEEDDPAAGGGDEAEGEVGQLEGEEDEDAEETEEE